MRRILDCKEPEGEVARLESRGRRAASLRAPPGLRWTRARARSFIDPYRKLVTFVADAAGEVKPPFKWDEDRRLRLRAKLDSVYFHLKVVTDRDDVRYIYSTFPIAGGRRWRSIGRYHSRDLCLAWISALAAGDPDAEIEA